MIAHLPAIMAAATGAGSNCLCARRSRAFYLINAVYGIGGFLQHGCDCRAPPQPQLVAATGGML